MVDVTAARPRVAAVRASLARWLTYAGVPLGIAACVAVGAFGFANGGYFPVSWGWGSLALLALMALALAVGVSVELGILDPCFLVGFAGLVAWIALSLLWTTVVPDTVLEIERVLVYLAAAAAGVLLVRRRSVASVVVGLWAALVVVATYALLTRLFPDQFGDIRHDLRLPPLRSGRLLERARDPRRHRLAPRARAGRAKRAARPLPLGRIDRDLRCSTLYFTYSRASWIALFVGLAVAVALDTRRLQLITIGARARTLVGHRGRGRLDLSRADAPDRRPRAASRDGHGLAVIAIGLVVAASLTILLVDWLASTVSVSVRRPAGVRRHPALPARGVV